MNEVTKYEHEVFGELEVFTVEGELYFYGKDMAAILGYTNPNKALRDHVDLEDKVETKRSTLGGSQLVWAINESGMYSLVLRSKLPQAKIFKRWVTKEVLPAIRKNGGYLQGQETMTPEEIMASAFLATTKTIEEKTGIIEKKEDLIQDKNYPMSLSKMYGGKNKTVQAINITLEEMGYITKVFSKGKYVGWGLTDKGEDLGLGSQFSAGSVYCTQGIMDILPSERELILAANDMGLINHKVTS